MARRPRILLTRRWPGHAERRLREVFEVTPNRADRPLSLEALRAAFRDFDAICPTVTDRIACDSVSLPGVRARLIANFGAGLDHIDLRACRKAGIAVTNTPDVLTESTADLAMLLILMAARRAGEGERELRSGAWTGWRPTHLLGSDVSGKTLGLIGFGRIARAVARRANAGFGMKVLYHSRRPAGAEADLACSASFVAELGDLMAASDFVSVHVPGGPATANLVGEAEISAMTRGAFLVNTSRGGVVDEDALMAALRRRRIAGAGLDVYRDEPSVAAGLLQLDNVVLLPHLGSATAETRNAMGLRVLANLEAYFAGREPPDLVR